MVETSIVANIVRHIETIINDLFTVHERCTSGTDEYRSPFYLLSPYPMCNGLPLPSFGGIFPYEPVDADAAAFIASALAKIAKTDVCPHIRQCFRSCLQIHNKHPYAFPDVPAIENPDGVDGRSCEVFVNCDQDPHNRYFACETIPISPQLIRLQEAS